MQELISTNPATGDTIWQGVASDAAAVDAAVTAAREAQQQWNVMGMNARLEIMERFRSAMENRRSELAKLISKETGKPLWDAIGEVNAVIGKLAISADAYLKRTGKHRAKSGDVEREVRHRPHGVMAVFGPYNFPAHLPNGHIMPALLAGNTIVFKPSDQTPAVGQWLVDQWKAAGIPSGVVNLVQGGKETGMALVAHPDVNGILFTGSYATGKAIHQSLAGRPEVLLALEMGGNNPLIVWDVADAKGVAKLVAQSAYLTSGQRCTCARRLIIPTGKAGDNIVEAVKAQAERLKLGAFTESPEPFMGPVINNDQAAQLFKAEAHLMVRGGTRILPLKRREEHLPFLFPALIDVTDVSMRPDEEYFGPFLQIIRLPNFEAALKEANTTEYGLAAGLISDNQALWKPFHAVIRAGIINFNSPTTGASSGAPFGGIGRSGNHRPAAYYAADYCAYPVASIASEVVSVPSDIPGMA